MFSCAVGREEHCKKYHWHVWGVLAVSGPHWVCPCSLRCVLSSAILLRLQVALQGNWLRQALGCMHFPGLSHSCSCVLHKSTDLVGPVFCALPRSKQLRKPGAWRVHFPQVGKCVLSPPPFQQLGFLGAQQECHLRSAVCLLWGADLWL